MTTDAENLSEPLIELRGVSKQFGMHQILRDISLTVQQGGLQALIPL